MKLFAIILSLFCVSTTLQKNNRTVQVKKMTVSQMKRTTTFKDVMPQPPAGWVIDSFQTCFTSKRGDWKCMMNAGEDFNTKTISMVSSALINHAYIFGDPVYADSFGVKIVTSRFYTAYSIMPDK